MNTPWCINLLRRDELFMTFKFSKFFSNHQNRFYPKLPMTLICNAPVHLIVRLNSLWWIFTRHKLWSKHMLRAKSELVYGAALLAPSSGDTARLVSEDRTFICFKSTHAAWNLLALNNRSSPLHRCTLMVLLCSLVRTMMYNRVKALFDRNFTSWS